MNLTHEKLVYVYSDGSNYDNKQENKTEPYTVRLTAFCSDCNEYLDVEYGEPFAYCKCSTTEWCK